MTASFDKEVKNLPEISKTTFAIAGIQTHVFGLSQLPSPEVSREVACLFLMHPRLEKAEYMEPIARRCLGGYYSELSAARTRKGLKGLIAVTFDQRNHGTRLIHPLANESWRDGNPLHAQDMMGNYIGTYLDLTLVLDLLPAYAFPTSKYSITTNMCAGVSLGGHVTWLSLMNEPRVTAGVVIVGCPDYKRVMTHRAEKTKLVSFGEGTFLGSKDFSPALLRLVRKYDPAGQIIGEDEDSAANVRMDTKEDTVRRRIAERLDGKQILTLSGGADKLVPYECSKPFINLLQAEGKNAGHTGVGLRDIVYDDVGHVCTEQMVVELIKFVCDYLKEGDGPQMSKM